MSVTRDWVKKTSKKILFISIALIIFHQSVDFYLKNFHEIGFTSPYLVLHKKTFKPFSIEANDLFEQYQGIFIHVDNGGSDTSARATKSGLTCSTFTRKNKVNFSLPYID